MRRWLKTWITAPSITPNPETGAGTWTDDMSARAIREGNAVAYGDYLVHVAVCGERHTPIDAEATAGRQTMI